MPVIVAAALLIPTDLGVSLPIAGVIGIALTFALGDLARRRGKRLEQGLFDEWGGKPTSVLLRHGNSSFEASSVARYRGLLAEKVGHPWPTTEEERAEPAAADAYYESCATWLRENTRNSALFPVLFGELITYGFRRNSLGLKWLGLALDLLLVAGCIVAFAAGVPFEWQDEWGDRLMIVGAMSLVHGLYLLTFVTKASVKEAAYQYARQLILSCESFVTKRREATQKRGNG